MTLPDTFWSKVHKTDSCWLWTGAIQSRGYGSFAIDGKAHSTHRLAYIDAKGPIPKGLTVDHLCFVRHCVNPKHLDAVTISENNRRARVRAGYYEGGQCGFGHPLEAPNLRVTARGRLACRECSRRHKLGYLLRRAGSEVAPVLIRAWARSKGMTVADVGRIPRAIREAYLEDQENAA